MDSTLARSFSISPRNGLPSLKAIPHESIELRRRARFDKKLRRKVNCMTIPDTSDKTGAYEPAKTADDLLEIGSRHPLWNKLWDKYCPYYGFQPHSRQTDDEVITATLYRALVKTIVDESGPTMGHKEAHRIARDIGEGKIGGQIVFSPEGIVSARPIRALVGDETSERAAPTESEEDVAADRSTIDPLAPETTPAVDETVEKANPTESEEDVAADRSTADPLKAAESGTTYAEVIASLHPSWLQVSLNQKRKFAVSISHVSESHTLTLLLAHEARYGIYRHPHERLCT